MLQVAMQDPASFLIIISGSANDIALRSGKPNSRQSIEYKAQAMEIVNKRLATHQSQVSDGTINACSMLAGTEVSHSQVFILVFLTFDTDTIER